MGEDNSHGTQKRRSDEGHRVIGCNRGAYEGTCGNIGGDIAGTYEEHRGIGEDIGDIGDIGGNMGEHRRGQGGHSGNIRRDIGGDTTKGLLYLNTLLYQRQHVKLSYSLNSTSAKLMTCTETTLKHMQSRFVRTWRSRSTYSKNLHVHTDLRQIYLDLFNIKVRL